MHGTTPLPLAPTPSSYSGELFGVEYLYNQTGQRVLDSDNIEERIDEGFGDVEEEEEEEKHQVATEAELGTVASPDDTSEEEGVEVEDVCPKK